MTARSKPLNVRPAAEAAHRTEATSYEKPEAKAAVRMVDAENMDELVRLLHEEAKVI